MKNGRKKGTRNIWKDTEQEWQDVRESIGTDEDAERTEENRTMSCKNCENFDPEDYVCTVQCGVYHPDSVESEGCPYWEPVSEQEEERRTETYGTGCIVIFLLLPFFLLMKMI